ncbi:hypothetical protein FQZ97_1043080 [compost metagenome]
MALAPARSGLSLCAGMTVFRIFAGFSHPASSSGAAGSALSGIAAHTFLAALVFPLELAGGYRGTQGAV